MNTDTITPRISDSAKVDVLLRNPVSGMIVDNVGVQNQAYMEVTGSTFTNGRHEGKNLPYSLAQSDGVFLFFFLCFMMFAHILKGNFVFLKENVMVALSLRQKHDDSYETTSREVGFSIFLLVQAVVLISFCIYDTFSEYMQTENSTQPLLIIVSFILLILVFFALKFAFYKVFGYIFELKYLTDVLVQTNLDIFKTLGILFYIPVLFLIYLEYWHIYIICFMLLLFALSLILFFVRIINYFVKEKFNFLFLIAYLCSVEIIPYLFLGFGLVYLYKTDLFSAIL